MMIFSWIKANPYVAALIFLALVLTLWLGSKPIRRKRAERREEALARQTQELAESIAGEVTCSVQKSFLESLKTGFETQVTQRLAAFKNPTTLTLDLTDEQIEALYQERRARQLAASMRSGIAAAQAATPGPNHGPTIEESLQTAAQPA